jgi:hypothetical protein
MNVQVLPRTFVAIMLRDYTFHYEFPRATTRGIVF